MQPEPEKGEKDLSELFGLEALSEEEQAEFITSIGTTLFQSALLTFTLSLEAGEREAFEEFLSEAGEGEELMEKLVLEYPAFAEELNAEITRFRTRAAELLQPADGVEEVSE
jgi:hypothetical protein